MTLLDHLPSNVLHPPSSVLYSFSVCASIRLAIKMIRFALPVSLLMSIRDCRHASRFNPRHWSERVNANDYVVGDAITLKLN